MARSSGEMCGQTATDMADRLGCYCCSRFERGYLGVLFFFVTLRTLGVFLGVWEERWVECGVSRDEVAGHGVWDCR